MSTTTPQLIATPDPQPTEQGQINPASSWTLVILISAAPQWELLLSLFLRLHTLEKLAAMFRANHWEDQLPGN